jgi:hypothetical protein
LTGLQKEKANHQVTKITKGHQVKQLLNNCQNVIPAEAGIHKNQGTGHRLPPV